MDRLQYLVFYAHSSTQKSALEFGVYHHHGGLVAREDLVKRITASFPRINGNKHYVSITGLTRVSDPEADAFFYGNGPC